MIEYFVSEWMDVLVVLVDFFFSGVLFLFNRFTEYVCCLPTVTNHWKSKCGRAIKRKSIEMEFVVETEVDSVGMASAWTFMYVHLFSLLVGSNNRLSSMPKISLAAIKHTLTAKLLTDSSRAIQGGWGTG